MDEETMTQALPERGNRTAILIRAYLWRRQKNSPMRLEASTSIECDSVWDGKQVLEKLRAGKTGFDGAHLLRVTINAETGAYEDPEYLDRAGDVPDIGA